MVTFNKPLLLEKYNNKIHSSLGISPTEASKNPGNVVTEVQIKNTKKPQFAIDDYTPKVKFAIGDYVRIYRKKKHFEKGYTHKWTNEIFIVDKIFYPRSGSSADTSPITYGIKDLKDEEILGRFYTAELQKTSFHRRTLSFTDTKEI